MASAWHFILFFFLLVVGLCDATVHNILDFAMARKHELWMARYGRVYEDEAEKAQGFEIFKKNIKYIEDFNRVRGHKYTLGEGPFTDLTTKEFLATYVGGLKVPKTDVDESLKSFKYESMESVLNYTSLPSKVDWRTKGAVSSVKNQGSVCSKKSFSSKISFSFLKLYWSSYTRKYF